jgi:hypothetical protein
VARFGWLFDLHESRAIAYGANSFRRRFAWFFHTLEDSGHLQARNEASVLT